MSFPLKLEHSSLAPLQLDRAADRVRRVKHDRVHVQDAARYTQWQWLSRKMTEWLNDWMEESRGGSHTHFYKHLLKIHSRAIHFLAATRFLVAHSEQFCFDKEHAHI